MQELAEDFQRTGLLAESALNFGYGWDTAVARLVAAGALRREDIEALRLAEMKELYAEGIKASDVGGFVGVHRTEFVGRRLREAGVVMRGRYARLDDTTERAHALDIKYREAGYARGLEPVTTEAQRLMEELGSVSEVAGVTGTTPENINVLLRFAETPFTEGWRLEDVRRLYSLRLRKGAPIRPEPTPPPPPAGESRGQATGTEQRLADAAERLLGSLEDGDDTSRREYAEQLRQLVDEHRANDAAVVGA